MTRPRGTCSHCGRSTALRKDGTVRDHQNPRGALITSVSGRSTRPWCPGSGRPPHPDGGPRRVDLPIIRPAYTDRCTHPNIHPNEPEDSYVAWLEWANRMNETHIQRWCEHCRQWTIWEPRYEPR